MQRTSKNRPLRRHKNVKMPDFHKSAKFPHSCSDNSSESSPDECIFQGENPSVDVSNSSHYNPWSSLDFAKNLVTRSREGLYNPTQSLHLLSCGVETLRPIRTVSFLDFFSLLHVLWSLALNSPICSETFDEERIIEKKVPEEHLFFYDDNNIINHIKDGCEKSTDRCCDGEGSTKASSADSKETKNTSTSSNVKSGAIPKTESALHFPRRSRNSGDDDDDDDEKRRRKLNNWNRCNGSFQQLDEEEKDEEIDSGGDGDDLSNNDSSNGENNTIEANENDCVPSGSGHQEASMTVLVDDDRQHQHKLNEEADESNKEEKKISFINTESNQDGNKEVLNKVVDISEEHRGLHDDEEGNSRDTKVESNGASGNTSLYDDNHTNGITKDFDGLNYGSCNYERGSSCTPPWSKKPRTKEDKTFQKAFMCNTEVHNMIEKCSEQPCYEIHLLLQHSRDCKYRVFGGCQECLNLSEIYIHHVQHCNNRKCVVSRCSEIKVHVQHEGEMLYQNWGYKEDQLFFGDSCGVSPAVDAPEITHDEIMQLIQEISLHGENIDNASNSLQISFQEINDLISEVSQNSFTENNPWPSDLLENSAYSTVSRGIQYAQDQIILEPDDSKRPADVTVLHPLDEDFLSVNNGRYDEWFEWMKVHRDRAYLGQGSFGKCYLNTDLKTNKLFATKKIPNSKYDANELTVWITISRQNVKILDLFGAVEIDGSVIIFMEYMDGGSVAQMIYNHVDGCLDEGTTRYIIREVLEGLLFLHSRCIVHCDVKAENVFVNSTLTKIKLGDYGAALQLSSLDYEYPNHMNGTEYFMSPEACRSEEISFSTDIWSCAASVVQMLTGNPLFYDFGGSIIYKIGSLMTTPPLPECSDETKQMLTKMFALKPSERPTAQELLQYPCLSEENCPPREMPVSRSVGFSDGDEHTPLGVQDVGNLAAAQNEQQSVFIDEELYQLQSDFLLSLSLDGANVSEYLPTVRGFDQTIANADQFPLQDTNRELYDHHDNKQDISNVSLHSPYSIKDLTKVEICNHVGELIFGVREKSSTTVKHLLLSLHSQIKERDVSLECFAVQASNDTNVDVNQLIGRTSLSLVLYPASGQDWHSKWGWRVNSQGVVECNDHVYG